MKLLSFLTILPVCLCVDLVYYVQERKSPGTYVGDIAADTHSMDSVLPKNHNLITFSQLQQGTSGTSQFFRVSRKTGKIYTTQTIDAESLCTRYAECFEMMDVAVRKGASFIKLLEIKIIIQDVNDHQPEFPQKQVHIEFEEDVVKGTKVLIPNAKDKDVGVHNSKITYQLKKIIKEPFSLFVSKSVDGTSQLAINLEERLDREVKDSYKIQVIAKDGGSPSKQSILDVHITVTDVNDNFPGFSQNVYNVSIYNDYDQKKPVVVLTATDLDLGKNGEIIYEFSSQTSQLAQSHFEIKEKTGQIFLHKKFESGQKTTYKLYVKATDKGNLPLSSLAMVLVNVINQQNNIPKIEVNYVFTSTDNLTKISEDIEVGSFIAYVKVTDHDVGQNGDIHCDLHHEKFQLQRLGSKKYKVIIKNQLDRETEDHHDIVINCQDKGSPPLHSEKKFSIQVMDVNDVQPQFPKETFKFRLYENKKSKIPVGSINATDPDLGSGGKLTYSLITHSKHFLPFQITDYGFISTTTSLDHELQDIYKFQVMVKDNGIPSLNNTVNIIVEVRDENDNAPYFTFPSINPFTMDVVYYPHHTNNITVLKASDIDSRENAFLRYEITAGNEKQLFTLNPYTGLLFFSQIVSQEDVGYYKLVITVKDSGIPTLSVSTNLSLILTVNNETLGVLNAVYMKTDDRIHMYLLIVIVLVAVIITVPVTATISICFIQCKEQRSDPFLQEVSSTKKGASEHLMCPPLLEIPQPDDYIPRSTDPDVTQNTPSAGQKQKSSPQNKRKKCSLLAKKLQKGPDIIYREIGEEAKELKQFMFPECKSECEDCWNGSDTRIMKQLPGPGISEFYTTHSLLRTTRKKPLQKRSSYPRDSSINTRNLKTPNIGHIPDCTQWIVDSTEMTQSPDVRKKF